jgi:hypothetical protein
MHRHLTHGLAALVLIGLLAGCSEVATVATDQPTVGDGVGTTTTVDPAAPQTATGANGTPADPRVGVPLQGRPVEAELAVGSCVNDHLVAEGERLRHVLTPRPCTQPHDAEVFAVFTIGAGPTVPFPGDRAMERQARSGCLTGFEPYVGHDYTTSGLAIAILRPVESTWVRGDRTVVCSAYDTDLVPLTGSVRGSGR